MTAEGSQGESTALRAARGDFRPAGSEVPAAPAAGAETHGPRKSHEIQAVLVAEREGWSEAAFALIPTQTRVEGANDLDSYRRGALFLARLAGEVPACDTSLRRMELVWRGDGVSRPPARLIGVVGAPTSAAALAAAQLFGNEVQASAQEAAGVLWVPDEEPATAALLQQPTAHRMRLRLVPRSHLHQAVIYPLHAETIEAALERESSPVTVRISFVVFPRRPLRWHSDKPDRDEARPHSPVATEGTGPRPERPDPAEQFLFSGRLEVTYDGEPPSRLMSATASALRGTGPKSIETVLAGTAAWVDAEWAADSCASAAAGVDEWPLEAPVFNLREMACLLAFPVPAGDGPSVPEALLHVPSAVPSTGWIVGHAFETGRPVAVGERDRLLHAWVTGRTGSGKSTTLKAMSAYDIRDRRKYPVVVFDMHGEFAEACLAAVPRWRIREVIYVNLADQVAPVAHNPLWTDDPARIPILVDAMTHLAQEMFDQDRSELVFGPIARRAFRNVLETVMAKPGSTFIDAIELLIDNEELEEYLPYIRSQALLRYWDQVERTSAKESSEQLPYLASKFSPWSDNLAVRRLIDRPRSTLDWDEVLANGYVVVVNLDASAVGPEAALFVARMLLHGLILAAKRRGGKSEGLTPVRLYIDEVQRLAPASPALQVALSEGRKYGISTVLANQNPEQLPDSLRASIETNVQTIVSFGVGVRAAPLVARMLGGDDELAAALPTIPNYRAVVRTAVSGQPQPPFLIDSPEPPKHLSQRRIEEVCAASRARFGLLWTDRERVMEGDSSGDNHNSGQPNDYD